MRITIVGAGPAGCLGPQLIGPQRPFRNAHDPQAPWEKPCGGGVTTKALSSFGIFESDLPRNHIDRITIYFGDKRSVTVTPKEPLAVVSRRELGCYLMKEAEKSGVFVLKNRITKIERLGDGWRLSTRDALLQSDFLIGADGATSLVRRSVSAGLSPEDLSVTLGYFIPGDFPTHMKIYFVPDFEGYIWSFPRPTHTSYGLITRSTPGWTARAKSLLSNFIKADLGPEVFEHAEFYSAPVPCLTPSRGRRTRFQETDGPWSAMLQASWIRSPARDLLCL